MQENTPYPNEHSDHKQLIDHKVLFLFQASSFSSITDSTIDYAVLFLFFQASSFSSITDSTMSLNIITVLISFQASSFSSITDSTMSLNIITVLILFQASSFRSITDQGYIWKMDLMGQWPIKSQKHGPGVWGPP